MLACMHACMPAAVHRCISERRERYLRLKLELTKSPQTGRSKPFWNGFLAEGTNIPAPSSSPHLEPFKSRGLATRRSFPTKNILDKMADECFWRQIFVPISSVIGLPLGLTFSSHP